jgi:hypothetical protein
MGPSLRQPEIRGSLNDPDIMANALPAEVVRLRDASPDAREAAIDR